jgi:hypothetical protein
MEKDIKQKIEPASTCVEPLERTTAEVVDEFDACPPLIGTGCYAYKSKYPDKSNSDIIEEVNEIFEDVTKDSGEGLAKYTVGLTEAEQADLELLSPNHKIGYCIYKSIYPEKSYSEIISELDKALSPRKLQITRLMGYVIDPGIVEEPGVDTSDLTFRQKIKRFFDWKDDDFI